MEFSNGKLHAMKQLKPKTDAEKKAFDKMVEDCCEINFDDASGMRFINSKEELLYWITDIYESAMKYKYNEDYIRENKELQDAHGKYLQRQHRDLDPSEFEEDNLPADYYETDEFEHETEINDIIRCVAAKKICSTDNDEMPPF